MRTKEEIKRQIDGLNAMKTWLPQYSNFGTNNWRNIDAQVEILEGGELSDMEEGNWEEDDEDNEAYREAEHAVDWLDGTSDEDLFETQ